MVPETGCALADEVGPQRGFALNERPIFLSGWRSDLVGKFPLDDDRASPPEQRWDIPSVNNNAFSGFVSQIVEEDVGGRVIAAAAFTARPIAFY